MNKIYVAIESFAALLVLFLLFANIFERRDKTKKNRAFTVLLLMCLVTIVLDGISWLSIGWEKVPVLFWIVNTSTYVIPCLIVAPFFVYLYEHISEKAETNRLPFRILFICCILFGLITFILCASGKMFTLEGSDFIEGPAEFVYYILYGSIMASAIGIIVYNRKKLGIHDFIVTLSFGVLPLFSFVLTLFDFIPLNIAIPSIGFDMVVIYTLIQSESEHKLYKATNIDELTRVFNRRAYEDDLQHYPSVPKEDDFIFAIVDINGLKIVNDNLGHVAGDELICGGANILKQTFGNHGKVYRVGGDEFVVMFFADPDKFEFLQDDFENVMNSWSGKEVSSIAMSIGFATKTEFKDKTVKEMCAIAEERMYKDKEMFYARKGFDRRGQNEAYKVLCASYTKILKINITDDSFSIINMNDDEIAEEKGFSNTISEWFTNFAIKGQVHPDDCENFLAKTNLEFMRDYFKSGKASLLINYRRKYDDVFKNVVMEIIPAKDYSVENQSLYLYVKNIDL